MQSPEERLTEQKVVFQTTHLYSGLCALQIVASLLLVRRGRRPTSNI
jgi:hypothetical protein